MDLETDTQLPPEFAKLSTCVEERPEAFARGDKEIQLAALQATKFVFDLALRTESQSRAQIIELLHSISPSQAPQTRSQTAAASSPSSNNKKRKRDNTSVKVEETATPKFPVPPDTPLPELCIEGMDEEQVWAQLELRAAKMCEVLEFALDGDGVGGGLGDEDEDTMGSEGKKGGVNGDVDMDELDDIDFEDEEEDSEEETEVSDEDEEENDEDEPESEEEEDEDPDADLGEDITPLRDPLDDSDDDIDLPDFDLDKSSFFNGNGKIKFKFKGKGKGKGHPELDDGFFDLAAFNAETEEAEAKSVSRGRLRGGDEDEDDEENEDFDEEVDLFAAVDDAEAEDVDEEGEPFYKDFFDPPSAGKAKPSTSQKIPTKTKITTKVRFHEEVRVKNIKAKGKNLPLNAPDDDDDDDDDEDGEDEDEDLNMDDDDEGDEEEGIDMDEFAALRGDGSSDEEGLDDEEGGASQDEDNSDLSQDEEDDENDGFRARETIERLKDDLFADEDDDENDYQEMTAHEKRMASLREEIASLEAENVAKKHWTLMGEASSRSRPQNTLLEEDLEFERVMKAVPVITEDVVQGLEERIKARIIESRFDDVVRKRPADDKPFLPSRFLELQDTKSKQSLAEIYEGEYVAAKSGTVAGEDRDGKLKKEHEELEKLWDNICSKLDALSNAHFTPKAPKATISTVSNVAAATLESALPTTKSASTMLAPEEVYAPSPSDLRARSELTPTQKRALRNKEKKARKKAHEKLDKTVDKFAKKPRGIKDVKKQKEAALKSVVKSGKGVTVIGKKGSM